MINSRFLQILISLNRFSPYFRHVLDQPLIQSQLYHSPIELSLLLQRDIGLLQLVLQHLVLEHQFLYLGVLVVNDALQFLLVALELEDDALVVFLPMVYGVLFFSVVDARHLELHSQAFDVLLVLLDL